MNNRHRLFPQAETRFTNSLPLKPLEPVLDKLYKKEKELRNENTHKHTVVSWLVSLLQEEIDKFNALSSHEDYLAEIKDQRIMLRNLLDILSEFHIKDKEVLSELRNHNKELAVGSAAATNVVVTGAAVGGALSGPMGWGLAAAAWIISLAYICSTDLRAETLLIIEELYQKCAQIYDTLENISRNHSPRLHM